jgi:hypothetical protein
MQIEEKTKIYNFLVQHNLIRALYLVEKPPRTERSATKIMQSFSILSISFHNLLYHEPNDLIHAIHRAYTHTLTHP